VISRLWSAAPGLVFAAALLLTAAPASAAGRDEIRSAYQSAKEQFNNLDLDAALAELDGAVSAAEGEGLGTEPMLGPVHVLRGGIIFSNTGNRTQTLAAFKQAVACDYNATLPIELRSADLQKILEEARRGAAKPGNEAFIHTPPPYPRGAAIEFVALANLALPDGAQVVLYWRKVGDDGEFVGESMTTFGNVGTFALPAAKHGDAPLQYFLYAFDASGAKTLANRGDKERPMLLEPSGEAATVADGDSGDPAVPGGSGGGGESKPKKDRGKSKLPRVFINLGVGTGLGVARGTAELTYQQFTPGPGSSSCLVREQACAIERWKAAEGPLAPDQLTFGGNLTELSSIAGLLPGDIAGLTAAYDAGYCSARHPVTTGLASAPFHIAPEIGVRVGKNIVVALFARLQVVTGSKVFAEDPDKSAPESFTEDVRSANPSGAQRKPPFSYAIGAKFKYFFGKDDRKFRVFAGAFAGYGFSRLRVDMGFSNDRNGNSVPDAIEIAYSGPTDASDQVDVANCTTVWPYTIGCDPDPIPGVPDTGPDRLLARTVAANTRATDTRIDTVRLGPGFIGGLVGFNYQIVEHFAVFAEVDVGVWFPATTSALFDLTLGPVITF